MPSKKLVFVNGIPTLVDHNQRVRQSSDKQYNQARRDNKRDYLAFYNSATWRELRTQVLLRDNGICQRCGMEATLVDHIIPSEDDWADRLNPDNLESLCKDCHYWKTRRETAKRKRGQHRAMQITVVAGYPGSGKTTYVHNHVGLHDLVYDYDALSAALTGQPGHTHNIDAHDYITLIYEMILRKLKAEQTFDHVWIIMTLPDEKLDSLLVNRNVNHIMLDTTKAECFKRLKANHRNIDEMAKLIDRVDEAKYNKKFDKFEVVSA